MSERCLKDAFKQLRSPNDVVHKRLLEMASTNELKDGKTPILYCLAEQKLNVFQ